MPQTEPYLHTRPTNSVISCVIPALNEYSNLQSLLPALEGLFANLQLRHELIVVNDGGTDATAQWARTWPLDGSRRYIELSRNFGKEAALSAGMQACHGDAVIFLDADMQHPPQLIEHMVDRWRQGCDMVYAVRAHRDDEPGFKRWGAALFYRILGRSSRVQIPADAGDFRLMDRKVINALLQLPERTRFMKGLYAWVGFRSEAVPYTPPPRLHGQSHFSRLRLIRLAVDGITAFSTWPLMLLTAVGAFVASLSFIYGLYIILEYVFVGNPVSGWVTLATSILFFSGINLLGLGVLGVYVARIFDEVKQRPLYLISHDSAQARPEKAA